MKKTKTVKMIVVICMVGLSSFAFAQPAVKVLGIENPEKIEKEVLALLSLLDVHENVFVAVRYFSSMPKNVYGITTSYPATDNYSQIIQVLIDAHINPKKQKHVLAHEMIHVKQFAKRELIILNSKEITWKGKKFSNLCVFDKHVPWEQEAVKREWGLMKAASKMELTIPSKHIYDQQPLLCNSVCSLP